MSNTPTWQDGEPEGMNDADEITEIFHRRAFGHGAGPIRQPPPAAAHQREQRQEPSGERDGSHPPVRPQERHPHLRRQGNQVPADHQPFPS